MPMPEKGWPYADAYLICLAPLYGRVAAIDETLGQYRRHSANTTDVSKAMGAELNHKLETMLETDLKVRGLLEQRADELGLTVSPAAVVDHWLHLKATLALAKLKRPSPARLLHAVIQFVRAIHKAPELTVKSSVLLTAWAVGVTVLPRNWAEDAIRYAFAAGNRKSRSFVRRRSLND